MRYSRGISLGTTLVIIGLVFTVGMALAGASVVHLNLLARSTHQEEALSLARSTASLSIERILSTPALGKTRAPADAVQLQLQGEDPKAIGLLTFEANNSQNITYSTNNLDSSVAVPGSLNRSVPPNSVHLIATGRSGGVEQHVEALLTVPPFPYPYASQNQIDATGGLEIAGITSAVAVTPGDFLPGDLLSNGDILLGPGSLIKGDVQSGGQVRLVNGAANVVQGAIRNNAAARSIPQLDLTSYDPQAKGYAFSTLPGAVGGNAAYQGMVRRQGDLAVSGDLILDGALLYVDGRLDVSGGIQGQGLVVATGSTNVQNCSDFKAGSNMALLSGSDLTLGGSGPEGSFMQGMVYSQGNFVANKVSVVGSLISQGTGTFYNARILSPPGSGKVTLPVMGPGSTGSSGGGGEQQTIYITNPSGDSWTQLSNPAGPPQPWQVAFTLQRYRIGSKDFWQLDAYHNDPGGYHLTYPPIPAGTSPTQPDATQFQADINDWVGYKLDLGNSAENLHNLQLAVGTPLAQTTFNTALPPSPSGPGPAGLTQTGNPPITIDPSSVLSLQDRIRLTIWREN